MTAIIEERHGIETPAQLDRIQVFMKHLLQARQCNDVNGATGEILVAGAHLLDATAGYAGECEGNVFHIQHRIQNHEISHYRLPLVMKGPIFLSEMFSRELPYYSNQVKVDPFIPSVLRTIFNRNVIGIPVGVGSRKFGFLFSGIVESPMDDSQIKQQQIEIFRLQIAGILMDMCNHANVRKEAETDDLTKMSNRRALTRYLQGLENSKEENEFTMLLLIDLDRLKRINDRYGHPAGDSAIQAVAECLKDLEDDRTRAFRVGGEEFIILMRGNSPYVSLRKAEEIQRKLGIFKMPEGSLTVSIGIAYSGPNGRPLEELLHAADEALYRAKYEGRNRVEIARMVS